MERRLNLGSRLDQPFPRTFWAYLSLVGLFVVDARLFSSTMISVKPANAIIFGLLILGLLSGNRLCRWLLVVLSIATALSILAVQDGASSLADAMLVAIPLAQAVTLSRPSMRALTATQT
jgi:hypothetical protein